MAARVRTPRLTTTLREGARVAVTGARRDLVISWHEGAGGMLAESLRSLAGLDRSPFRVEGDDLAALKATVQKAFVELDDHERTARTALARLEASMVRRFAELKGAP